jgi:heme exporter protein D
MGTRWSFYWTLMLLGVQALQAVCMTRVLLRGWWRQQQRQEQNLCRNVRQL